MRITLSCEEVEPYNDDCCVGFNVEVEECCFLVTLYFSAHSLTRSGTRAIRTSPSLTNVFAAVCYCADLSLAKQLDELHATQPMRLFRTIVVPVLSDILSPTVHGGNTTCVEDPLNSGDVLVAPSTATESSCGDGMCGMEGGDGMCGMECDHEYDAHLPMAPVEYDAREADCVMGADVDGPGVYFPPCHPHGVHGDKTILSTVVLLHNYTLLFL